MALLAFFALFSGPTRPAVAQDDNAPTAPAVAPNGRTGSASPSPVSPKAPAARSHQKDVKPLDGRDQGPSSGDSGNIAPPERDEEPTPSDPYARDPYDEPSEEHGDVEDGEGPPPDEPPVAGTHEPDAPSFDAEDAEPDDGGGE